MVGRRRFLLLGIGGSAAALIGGTSLQAAADAPTIVPVWRLSADWGYAVPPKNRTRCRCQGCRNHAANKVFVSKAAALGNRIHPCCVCQPYSIDLLAGDAASLFVGSPTGDSIDLRNDDSRGRFEAAMVRSLAPVPNPVPTSTTPTVTTAANEITFGPVLSASDPGQLAATTSSQSVSLPMTGANHDTLVTAAAVLVAAGVAVVAGASVGRADSNSD
jgi:hypothetical protein